ncbi:beta-phosphoglucomutase family hydrolase [Corynebacterium guangdongense]|uniref:Beta-phosphoglucomutase family hydrolase n=1 Tax=Corynebacterium guangdongense TaxID=1783348 RepID=A0ABU1ZU46_9CORY|nr:beta-phosphoglucomutase family hydrolase [Corynebacterium guangdongense]MDR7328447.1 beta-phosphoglucomutase family hydrolase [Corynebacterium guangdongense]WJZ17024.1 putative glycosyl hydrolase [Corynebacterium guangdongense]
MNQIPEPSAETLTSARRVEPDAVIFDMDGVVTDTSAVHARAWKTLFDEALPSLAPAGAQPRPFDVTFDYRTHVDGKTREDGVRDFLLSRDVVVEETTVDELAARKQGYFDAALAADGVRVFQDTVALIRRLREAGLPIGLVTASRNSEAVLGAGGILDLFDVRVDGNTARDHRLAGKPAPDMFLRAATALGASPHNTVVVEDSTSGVAAAFAGKFGLILGVLRDKDTAGDALYDAGADRLLRDLATIDLRLGWSDKLDVPSTHLLAYDSPDPEKEGEREAALGTGNGYWGTRAAVPGTVDDGVHYPGSYLAGVYNRVLSDLTDTAGAVAETEHLVNTPDWTWVRITDADGHALLPSADEILDERQELDLRTGVSRRTTVRRAPDGRITTVSTHHLHSLADAHTAALRVEVIPENWSGEVTVHSAINGDVRNRNVEDDHALETRHLSVPAIHHVDDTAVVLETRTLQSDVDVAVGTRTWVSGGGDPARADGPRLAGDVWRTPARAGEPLYVDKLAVAVTSRDPALSTPLLDATKRLERTGSVAEVAAASAAAWSKLWNVFNVQLEAGRTNHRALTFNTFHVLQNTALASRDLDAGTPARGLQGEGYRGHVFWDELFVYPTLSLRQPALTRALLMYRYRRLDEARHAALLEGGQGARFPWQSGSDGREETPSQLYNPMTGEWMPDNSHNQYHVGLDVAYAVWQYYKATGDQAFLTDHGAELLIEVARFFVTRAVYDEKADRYSLHGIMGPDEFHDGYPDAPGQGLRDNAYTNVLTSRILNCAGEALRLLDPHDSEALRSRLGLSDTEVETWDHISRRLRLVFHTDGVLSQFDGYEELEELDWEGYHEKYGDIGRMDLILAAEGDSPNRYKVSKQADVLMLFYLFSGDELGAVLARMGYRMTRKQIADTIDYYVERTTHGSTLSEFIHAWAYSRHDLDRSWELYQQALVADLDNEQGSSTSEGIHLGVMSGTVDMLMRAYSGLQIRGDDVVLDPNLPRAVPEVGFQIHFLGQPLQVRITQDEVTLHLHARALTPLDVVVRGVHHRLNPGDQWVASLPVRE